jgi:hypothetical protein
MDFYDFSIGQYNLQSQNNVSSSSISQPVAAGTVHCQNTADGRNHSRRRIGTYDPAMRSYSLIKVTKNNSRLNRDVFAANGFHLPHGI